MGQGGPDWGGVGTRSGHLQTLKQHNDRYERTSTSPTSTSTSPLDTCDVDVDELTPRNVAREIVNVNTRYMDAIFHVHVHVT